MANEEHLKILEQGVETWNKWRADNTRVFPDLTGANLSRAKLNGAHLRGVDLRQGDLSMASLFRAKLNEANLREANLFKADLMTVDLSRANLTDANLAQADLSRADLSGANLAGANLAEMDLHAAYVGYTVFGDVDLSTLKGLETIKHSGPSIIGIETIYRSQGNIPEIFLRGAGIPEPFIANMKSLVAAMSPIQFYSCFISYSSKDQEFADRLFADLQAKGVRCWYAPEDLKIGDPFRQRIDDAIRLHDKLLVVLSKTSVASSWVESEVEAALEREQRTKRKDVLFPICLDQAVENTEQAWAADVRRQRHMGDFGNWKDHDSYRKAFDRLLRDLQGAPRQSVSVP